jgi:NodT family efflux transporter outer membrane factor (OMF) lipoprotein
MRWPILACFLLAGCMVGPDYNRPAEPHTAAGPFVDPGSTKVSTASAEGQWWHLFEDPTLDRLVTEALTYNSDVRVAAANVRRARAVLQEERGNLLPGGQATAQYSYERNGANGAQGQNAQTDTRSFYNVGIDAGYQVDLWGGIRRGIEAARGDVGAAQAALDAARITVAAETARMYAQACGFAAQAHVARDTAELQQKTLDLTHRLMTAGRGTQRDVDQAVVLTENARAQVPQLEAERRASLYALAALTGRTPAELDAEAARCTVPPDVHVLIPVGDGAALIARRPDVRRAERLLAADTARIGVAVSELYPSITLLGSISLGARRLGDLSDKDSLSFSLGPLIQWNLANLTQGRSRIHQAEARADASLATFDGAVLTALKEVEQALARYSGEIERNVALRHAEAAASNAARIAEARFDAGRDSFLQRLDAERDRAAARGALAQSNTALAEAQVALFNALGGGWEQAPQPQRRVEAVGPAGPSH